MSPLIKVCGMREPANIRAVAKLKPDIMGFIFYPSSPRFTGDTLDPEALPGLSTGIRKTGVFVNAGYRDITKTVRKYSLDMVQLHGNETPELCCRLKDDGIQVIKAFNINDDTGFRRCSPFIDCTDYFLFDTVTPGYGGSGNKFSWKILKAYDLGHPFFLSGGISLEDVAEIKSISNPFFYAVDLNSRFETEPGLKDTGRLKQFMEELRF